MKLWWPHCEAMVAFAMAFKHTRSRHHWRRFDMVCRYVDEHFVDKKYGGEWFGYLSREGKPTHTFKGAPYKGWYVCRGTRRLSYNRFCVPPTLRFYLRTVLFLSSFFLYSLSILSIFFRSCRLHAQFSCSSRVILGHTDLRRACLEIFNGLHHLKVNPLHVLCEIPAKKEHLISSSKR